MEKVAEQIVEHHVMALVDLMEKISFQGVTGILKPFALMVNTQINASNVKEGLDTFKESLWIPSEGEEKGSNSLQVIMIAQGMIAKMSVEQMTKQWGHIDYTKVHLRLIERLKEINFNFDLNDAYIKGIQEIIKKSPEYVEIMTGGMAKIESDDDGSVEDDDIPF